jgi:hypothetical protein
MHNLKSNFYKFFHITKSIFSSQPDDLDKLYYPYWDKPNLSYSEINALMITGNIWEISL